MVLPELTREALAPAARPPSDVKVTPNMRAVVEADAVSRRFRRRPALDKVSLKVREGEIHALLGPNGAGKTTLLRILSGLTAPDGGSVRVLGNDVVSGSRSLRQALGLVPSGDRSFYLRISGFENLLFFARMHGLGRRPAAARARELLELVGLSEAARTRVGEYSHGMQKRLSVARGLLTEPAVLLVDEATHDLDPEGARLVQDLVAGVAERGAAVVWATQRIDEIRGFADRVTLLRRGEVCFAGTVAELLAHSVPRRFLLRIGNELEEALWRRSLSEALAFAGTLAPAAGEAPGHVLLTLADGAVLGHVLARLSAVGIEVHSCTEERSGMEEAFLELVRASS